MEWSKPVTDLIRQRRSVRNYSREGFTPELENRIREILSLYVQGPMGNRVTFHLVHKPSIKGKKIKLGTYGFIKGARYFVAGTVKKAAFAEEDYGYLLEIIMLHMLDMGLGTCWLGGTFKRSEWAELLKIHSGAVIPAITPVGNPAASMSKREQWIRKGAKSDQRKPREELFFTGDFSEPLTPGPSDNLFTPLEMVRLGPSASNKQPWRIVQRGDNFHFFLSRTPGYGKYVNHVELQRIDMGIAMAHFELACRETGIRGEWKRVEHGISSDENTEYIVSWVHSVES